MKIVLANKYFYPRGGDCLYTLRLMSLLRDNGHTVIPFGMNHPQNIRTEYDKYFVSYIDYNEELKKRGIFNAIKVASRAVVNFGAAKAISLLIEDNRPDLIHLQNIHHQLTPSVVLAAAQFNIPVVWTLHDFILNCPNDNFFRGNGICTRCAAGNNIHAVLNKCKKDSLGASFLAALECTVYHRARLVDYVSKFICPSHFMAEILVESGTPPAKVAVIPNFMPVSDTGEVGGEYFLFAGRLNIEKGVEILLAAFKEFDKGKLLIAGDGPNLQSLLRMAKTLKLNNVEFLGYQPPAKIRSLLAGCRASIVSSIIFENLPYAVMETMMAGKTVIASRIGGIPEMIEHDINGLLFESGNSSQLARMLNLVWADKSLAQRLGIAAREKAISAYSSDKHYSKLLQIYNEALGRKSNSIVESPDNIYAISSEELIGGRKG